MMCEQKKSLRSPFRPLYCRDRRHDQTERERERPEQRSLGREGEAGRKTCFEGRSLQERDHCIMLMPVSLSLSVRVCGSALTSRLMGSVYPFVRSASSSSFA